MNFIVFVFNACNPPDEEMVYDYSLQDINNSSATHEKHIGPGYFKNEITLHYFGHQNWSTCTARVEQLDALYQDLVEQELNNVKIIVIGQGQYYTYNSNWTNDNSIPVVNDPSPNDTWTNWGANQRDLFFLDTNGNYVEDFNITIWDYNKIYNSIININSGCTDFEDANYDPDATIDDGSCV